jgi:hypothetical protein
VLPVRSDSCGSIIINLLLVPLVHHLDYEEKIHVEDFLLEREFHPQRAYIEITNGEAMSAS